MWWGWPKVTTIHPEGHMNVCTKFHVNPDISLKTSNVNLMIEEKSGYHQSQGFILWGTVSVCTKFHGNPSRSCLRYFTEQLTNITNPRAMSLVWLIKMGSQKQASQNVNFVSFHCNIMHNNQQYSHWVHAQTKYINVLISINGLHIWYIYSQIFWNVRAETKCNDSVCNHLACCRTDWWNLFLINWKKHRGSRLWEGWRGAE